MLKRLLPVFHQRQRRRADCLAACAAMVLDYIGRPCSYQRLLSLLDVKPIGAPSSNILRLTRLGVSVSSHKAGSLEELELQIVREWPCIVFLDTDELPYWPEATFGATLTWRGSRKGTTMPSQVLVLTTSQQPATGRSPRSAGGLGTTGGCKCWGAVKGHSDEALCA